MFEFTAYFYKNKTLIEGAGEYFTEDIPITQALTVSSQKSRFLGQFDLTTDKKNMKIFGFGGHTEWYTDNGEVKTRWVKDNGGEDFTVELDEALASDVPTNENDKYEYTLPSEDFSIEFKDHVPICAFRTPDFTVGDANTNFEYRYPEEYTYINSAGLKKTVETLRADVTIGMEKGEAMHSLFDFVANCDPRKEQNNKYYVDGELITSSHTGFIPTLTAFDGTVSYGGKTWIQDTVNNRKRLFKEELKYYAVVNQLLIYFLATLDFPLGVDQEGKNLFASSYGSKDLNDGTSVDGDTATLNGTVRRLIRFLGYDYDTNLRLDNRNNFKFNYTERYEDHHFDEGILYSDGYGVILWDLLKECFADELREMRLRLYGSLLSSETVNASTGERHGGMLWYLFDNHTSHYNSVQYNLNSEGNYTISRSDYSKSHGSAKEDIEWFVRGRFKFLSGLGFNPSGESRELSSDFARANTFIARPSGASVANLGEANYYNMMGHWPEDASNYAAGISPNETDIFRIDFTCYERNTVGMAVGSGTLRSASVYSDVTPVYTDNIITGYNRDSSSLKLPTYVIPKDDFAAYLYGTEQIKTIAGLDKWYLKSISSWGGLTNVEELNIGSTAMLADSQGNQVPYTNALLTDANLGFTGNIFGSCKVLNLAGCTSLANVDLNPFPVLRTFEGTRMDGATNITLPAGSSLETVHYPSASLTRVVIDNKPNLTEIRFDQLTANNSMLDNLTEVQVTNSSQVAAVTGIELLTKYYN